MKVQLASVLLFGLASHLATAQDTWKYLVVDSGGQVTMHKVAPVDLSYPADGSPAPTRHFGEPQLGTVLSEDEYQERMARPHLIIATDTRSVTRGSEGRGLTGRTSASSGPLRADAPVGRARHAHEIPKWLAGPTQGGASAFFGRSSVGPSPAASSATVGLVYVQGYERRDGTHVRAHYRSRPRR